MPTCAAGRERGLTLIEIVVVVAIIALISGMLAPVVGDVMNDAKASKILAVTDALKKGCERHYADTATYALEQSDQTAAAKHMLSLTQTTPGWSGPYLDHPLSSGDSPFGGDCIIYDDLSAASGFDPMGAGSASITGDGQIVEFTEIPTTIAELVDSAMDNNVPGDWKATGRVEYDPSAANGTLRILLMYEQ